jgi:hypothetical protein
VNLPILTILALCVGGAAQASETMRCGKWVVDDEATLKELLSKCGAPATREVKEEDVHGPSLGGRGTRIIGKTKTERWTYDRGSRAFRMVVTIVDGKIKSIDKAQ